MITANTKVDSEKLDFVLYLYVDIVQNRKKLTDDLFIELTDKIRRITPYHQDRKVEEVDDVISYMKNKIWVDLYGKTYDEF